MHEQGLELSSVHRCYPYCHLYTAVVRTVICTPLLSALSSVHRWFLQAVGVVRGDIRKVPSQTAPAAPVDANAAFLELLREVGVHGESRWAHTKSKVDHDPRYKVGG